MAATDWFSAVTQHDARAVVSNAPPKPKSVR